MILLAELREKVLLAELAGRKPVAVVMSRDTREAFGREVGELAAYVVADPKVAADTFMALPVEIMDGRNHLSVRVEG